ncbi:MAG TPA: hypothetical protein VNZ49_11050 [Bacteroidia bacterium]|jgi:hypothetical protein|nr:hypothetical protein [Bacteroidia bacterium]
MERAYISRNSKVFKNLRNAFRLFVFALLFENNLHSQVLVQYDAANYNSVLNSLNASGCSSGLATYSTLQISAASTTPYGYCAGRFAFCGYFQITAKSQPGYAYCSSAAPSLSTTPDYLTFTVTPNSSNCVYITQFNITMGTYSTGGDKVLVGYSNDGGVTWVVGPTFILPL